MRRFEVVTLAGIAMFGNMALARMGSTPKWMAVSGSVVTVAGQVGREAAGTVAALYTDRRSITLTAFDTPQWAIAGTQYRARFVVRNRGDVPATIVLTLATRDSLTHVDPSMVTLAPGASAIVNVLSTSARNQGIAAIGLRATDRDAPDVHATATVQTAILGDRS